MVVGLLYCNGLTQRSTSSGFSTVLALVGSQVANPERLDTLHGRAVVLRLRGLALARIAPQVEAPRRVDHHEIVAEHGERGEVPGGMRWRVLGFQGHIGKRSGAMGFWKTRARRVVLRGLLFVDGDRC